MTEALSAQTLHASFHRYAALSTRWAAGAAAGLGGTVLSLTCQSGGARVATTAVCFTAATLCLVKLMDCLVALHTAKKQITKAPRSKPVAPPTAARQNKARRPQNQIPRQPDKGARVNAYV